MHPASSSSPPIRGKVTHYGQHCSVLFRTRISFRQVFWLSQSLPAFPSRSPGQWRTTSKDIYSNNPESGLQRRDRSRFGLSPHGIPSYALRHLKVNLIKTHILKFCQQESQIMRSGYCHCPRVTRFFACSDTGPMLLHHR